MPLTWDDTGSICWSVTARNTAALTSTLSNTALTTTNNNTTLQQQEHQQSLAAYKQGKVELMKLFLQQTQPFYHLDCAAAGNGLSIYLLVYKCLLNIETWK